MSAYTCSLTSLEHPLSLYIMFVRTVKRKNTENLGVQIVESYRNSQGKPRQRIVRNMGSAPPGDALKELVRIAEIEKQKLLHNKKPSLFPPDTMAKIVIESRRRKQESKPLPIANARLLKEHKRLTVGFHEVFGELYSQLGFDRVWGARHRMSARLFEQAVMMRLAAPGQSKSAHARLSAGHGVEVSVEKFYRMMDGVDEKRIDFLQRIVSREVMGLLGGKVDVVFFDVTTLSFASEEEDSLRRKGWSKDGKPHRVQVVLALVQTKEGLPTGYELFAGNTADVSTLEPVLERLGERFDIDGVVVVADAGMASEDNIRELESRGCDWVVAARLRKLGKKSLNEVVNWEQWREVGDGRKVGDLDIGGRRLVLRHCASRARKDALDREVAVEKAAKRLSEGIKGSGRRGRYLKVEKGSVSISEEAIRRDEQFDGLHGVWTSLEREKHSAEEVYRHYAELWRIEEGFRVMKHTMAVRPVFHWTQRRVRAHVAVCFAAFAMLRILRWKHNRSHPAQESLSEQTILRELGNVEVSLLRDEGNGKQYLVPSSSTKTQRLLYATAGCRLSGETVPVDQPLRL